MKIKKLLTAMTCAALITAAALPLTACGGAKSLKKAESTVNLADYAEAYESETSYSHDAITKAETRFTGYTDAEQIGYSPFIRCETELDEKSYYGVINGYTGNSMYSNLTYASAISVSNSYYILDAERDNDFHDYLGEDGTEFFTNIRITDSLSPRPSFVLKKYYLGEDDEKSDVIVATYNNYIPRYFKAEKINGQNFYDEITPGDIHFVEPDYASDSAAFAVETPVYSKTGETPVTDETAEYSYKQIGNEYVFSKAGTETGRVNIDGLEVNSYLYEDDLVYENNLAFVSNYMYYTKLITDRDDSKDANLVYTIESEQRYRYELHRYDFTVNEDKTLNYDIKVDSFQPLYNKNSKKFDALVIHGAKIKDNTYQNNAEFTYITDAELGLCYDLGNVPYDRSSKLYSLGETNYMIENTIEDSESDDVIKIQTVYDADMKKVSEFTNAEYSEVQKLMKFENNDEKYGVADLTGKVIIEPIYTDIEFYGDNALATNSATNKQVFLKTDGTETEAPKTDNESSKYVSYDSAVDGTYLTFEFPTKATGSYYTSYQMTVYNYAGTRLMGINNTTMNCTAVEKTLIVPVVGSDYSLTYSLVHIA